MKELKVGERITLEVVESSICEECFFYINNSCTIRLKCADVERSDNKDVIFKEVKE